MTYPPTWFRPTAALSLLLWLALAVAPLAAADLVLEKLVAREPPLAEIAREARRLGVTFGVWGGTVRDLYLGRPFTVISDYDMIFDSSEPGFARLRQAVEAVRLRHAGRMPSPDFHMDLAGAEEESERQRQLHEEGITATKVGVLADGRVLDPSGTGVEDLRNRTFRFHSPEGREIVELHNLGRFVRDLVRLMDFRKDPATLALLHRSLRAHADGASERGRRARDSARRCRELAAPGRPVTFRALMRPFRQDIRALHNGRPEELSAYFPADVFLFELFKAVTQAPDMPSLRRALALLDVDDLLRSLGLELEGAALTNPVLDREAIFEIFEFPGRGPPFPAPDATRLEVWEGTLRRYNYRVLLDMLASELEPGTEGRRLIEQRSRELFSGSRYHVLNLGDPYREEILGLLDADFNNGALPREKLTRALDWFLKSYLPFGDATLAPVRDAETMATPVKSVIPVKAGIQEAQVSSPVWTPAFARETKQAHPSRFSRLRRDRFARTGPPGSRVDVRVGYSPEVRAIRRSGPHSMAGLEAYLAVQVGEELVPLYLDAATSAAFIRGDREEAAWLLRSRGFDEIYQVNACGASRRHRTLLGFDRAVDRICIAKYGFYSDEQLLNHQARIYLLERGGRRLPGARVLVARFSESREFPGEGDIEAFLKSLGRPVSVLFVGFTNPLKRLLTGVRFHEVGDVRLLTGSLPGGGGLVVGLSGFGASYGSFPARLAEMAMDHGLAAIALVGTAGGLVPGVRRFDWMAPTETYLAPASPGEESEVIPFDNAATALGIPSGVSPVRHATVSSPLVETQEQVRQMRVKNASSVDCELHHLVAATQRASGARQPPRLYALVNITDFPDPGDGTRADPGAIDVENSPVQRRAVEKALAAIVRDLTRWVGR